MPPLLLLKQPLLRQPARSESHFAPVLAAWAYVVLLCSTAAGGMMPSRLRRKSLPLLRHLRLVGIKAHKQVSTCQTVARWACCGQSGPFSVLPIKAVVS